MPKDTNNIELRSDEVKDIIGSVPGRIIRYGILSVFSVVALLIVGSFFFSYPDVITARITLTGQNPPADIKARLNGKISEIFVSDRQAAEQEAVLAILESGVNYRDYEYLKSEIDRSNNDYLNISPHRKLQLGELQSAYTTFTGRLTEYHDFVDFDFHTKKIEALQKQHRAYEQSLQTARRQCRLIEQEIGRASCRERV
jgi:multidrug efflux pump subunit AcrA (membrane-fusion protein)